MTQEYFSNINRDFRVLPVALRDDGAAQLRASNVLVFRFLVGKMVHFWVWVAEYE